MNYAKYLIEIDKILHFVQMNWESRDIATSKGQLGKFSGIISKGFSKPKQRLIEEMLYGIQASKSGPVKVEALKKWGNARARN